MNGVLNLHKPTGLSSRAAIDRVEKHVRPAKVGHAGTLDPLASGVLVVCIGTATRLVEYVQRMPKTYVGTFLLGRESNTEDIEGEVKMLTDPVIPTREALEEAAAAMVGTRDQRPPAFSALKVGGKRAYDLARAGEEVELAPRPVQVYRLEVMRYEYPELELHVECGGGTYIRSLGRDLAENVGSAAVMSALVRTAIGPFVLDNAIVLEELTGPAIAERLAPLRSAVANLPAVELNIHEVDAVRRGLRLHRQIENAAEEMAAFDAKGNLVAILAKRADGRLAPAKTFSAE